MTGLWDAKVDRAPILALTGQVQTQVMGPGAFQDIDLKSAFQAVSAFSRPVLVSSNHAELASLACKTALVEQNVSHLIFPDDVQTLPSDQVAGGPDGRLSATAIRPAQSDIEAATEMITAAKRPVIVVGHGALDVREDVADLAVKLGAPVLTTFKAKGLVPDDHPNAAGVLGRSGTPIASWFMNEADLIIALGASFSNHTGIERSKEIVQVDYDRMQLGKFHPVALPVWSDVATFCTALGATLSEPIGDDQVAELAERATQDIESLKGRKVISISGDGGFGQYPMDFTTAVKYRMDVTHILLHNGELGKISKEQRSAEWPVWETNLQNPSFAAFARLCGGHGIKVKDPSEVRSAIQEALDHKGPALVEIMTDADLV